MKAYGRYKEFCKYKQEQSLLFYFFVKNLKNNIDNIRINVYNNKCKDDKIKKQKEVLKNES
jgi:hypothetical protein